MSINAIVLGGLGNGTVTPGISKTVTRGYSIDPQTVPDIFIFGGLTDVFQPGEGRGDTFGYAELSDTFQQGKGLGQGTI